MHRCRKFKVSHEHTYLHKICQICMQRGGWATMVSGREVHSREPVYFRTWSGSITPTPWSLQDKASAEVSGVGPSQRWVRRPGLDDLGSEHSASQNESHVHRFLQQSYLGRSPQGLSCWVTVVRVVIHSLFLILYSVLTGNTTFLLQCNIVAILFLCVIMCVCVDCIANAGSVLAPRWGMSLGWRFSSGYAWASASIDPLFLRFLDLALFLINCLIRWSWSNPLWMDPCIHSEY